MRCTEKSVQPVDLITVAISQVVAGTGAFKSGTVGYIMVILNRSLECGYLE